MCARRDLRADQLEMLGHGMGIAIRHDQPCALALSRADRAEDIGPFGALVVRRARAGSAPGPSAGEFVLLANAGFVLEPNLYRRPALLNPDVDDGVTEVFLNASMAASSWA